MLIRRLTPDDAAAHRALRLQGFKAHPEAFTTSWEELAAQPLADTERRLALPQLRFWGAFDGDKLCGQAGLERETRAKVRHKATLVGVYVQAEHRGRGLARQLVEAALADAHGQGLELVVLTVTEGNRAAQALYEGLGFQSFGIEPRAIKVGDAAHGKVHMAVDLRGPAGLTSPSGGRTSP